MAYYNSHIGTQTLKRKAKTAWTNVFELANKKKRNE